MSEWIGVDLDGTLAEYTDFIGPLVIGRPIPLMVARVKLWLREGKDVRIFTARIGGNNPLKPEDVSIETIISGIQDWTEQHLGVRLPVTCSKDYHMIELWDDRAIQVIPNTGVRADGKIDYYGRS